MKIGHLYPVGKKVFVKVESYPNWPARIMSLNKNGTYTVFFFGEKSQATVIEEMIMDFNQQSIEYAKKTKGPFDKQLKQAIKLAQRSFEEIKINRSIDSDQQQWALNSKKIRKNIAEKKHEKSGESRKQSKGELKNFHCRTYDQLKQLLDNFSCFAADFPNSKNSKNKKVFQAKDAIKICFLFQSQLNLKLIIESWVLDRLIITLKELQYWGVPKYEQVILVLKQKYEQYKSLILSPEFDTFDNPEHRKQMTRRKVSENKTFFQE